MKVLRKVIAIDEDRCDGCGLCLPSCAEGAIQVVDGKARLISEKFCDGLGACLGECPNNAIKIVEREAEEFDEKAVEEHQKGFKPEQDMFVPGCPRYAEGIAFQPPKVPKEGGASCLRNWPVQINLIPTDAPFLNGAHLLITADCVPLSYPTIHQDFMGSRVVMVGCPKFDDVKRYMEKFTQIFKQNGIKSIQVLRMEVPCCGGLPVILKRAMKEAGLSIPMEEVVVGIEGEVLSRNTI